MKLIFCCSAFVRSRQHPRTRPLIYEPTNWTPIRIWKKKIGLFRSQLSADCKVSTRLKTLNFQLKKSSSSHRTGYREFSPRLRKCSPGQEELEPGCTATSARSRRRPACSAPPPTKEEIHARTSSAWLPAGCSVGEETLSQTAVGQTNEEGRTASGTGEEII